MPGKAFRCGFPARDMSKSRAAYGPDIAGFRRGMLEPCGMTGSTSRIITQRSRVEHAANLMKTQERDRLLRLLKNRFENNMHRHGGVAWETVFARLEAGSTAMKSLGEMEASGGEPDVVGQDNVTGRFIFCDCSPESPLGRRSLCYDSEALNARKENKPSGSATEMAVAMGVELLTEEQYRELQQLGEFDAKTSSWIATPQDVRSRGGALFCDRRYGKVFTYHNGAQSYYAARGFRCLLRV